MGSSAILSCNFSRHMSSTHCTEHVVVLSVGDDDERRRRLREEVTCKTAFLEAAGILQFLTDFVRKRETGVSIRMYKMRWKSSRKLTLARAKARASPKSSQRVTETTPRGGQGKIVRSRGHGSGVALRGNKGVSP